MRFRCRGLFAGVMLLVLSNVVWADTLRIEAYVDGRSQLRIAGSTLQWYHLTQAAPGRWLFAVEPTIINGVQWFPVWPDVPDAENRFCQCFSSTFAGVFPPLPADGVAVPVNVLDGRGPTTVLQQPSSQNGFVLVVQFDDNDEIVFSGPDWYVIEIEVPDVPVAIDVTTWGAVKALYGAR